MPSVVVVSYFRAVEDGAALALWAPMVLLQTCAGGIAVAGYFCAQRLNFASQRSDFPLNVYKFARAHGLEHTAASIGAACLPMANRRGEVAVRTQERRC